MARPARRHGGVVGGPALLVRRVLLALLCALATAAVASPGTAWGASAGTATITRPGSNTPLDGGGSHTLYGVALPGGATCPGDTAHDGYVVDSYLVPQGVTPTEVSYRGGVPRRWFGYISGGAYFGAVNTALGTGQIQPLPAAFTWTRLTPSDLFPDGGQTATWEGGIACVNGAGTVTDYWNTQVVFTADAADPGGFTWKVDQPPSAPTSPVLWVGLGLLAVAVVAGGIAVVQARRSGRSRSVPPSGPAATPRPAPEARQPEPAGP